MEKNLGHATAYGYAKSKGYSGTEEEFAELMADYASVGQSAAQSAEQAAASATSASDSAATATQAAQTATSKASEAVTAADTATTKASEASQSASTASAAATSAITSAQTATTAATTATTKASEASESAATATTAKTDAETARDAAAQSASEAAASAESIDPDEFDRKIYAAFVTDTASGSIASFADGADNIPMKDVLVYIEPVQDLHGYEHPWPAGGGKNKFNGAAVATSNTSNWGVTWDDVTATLTIEHKNTYSTGTPNCSLTLAPGTYTVKCASATDTFEIRKNGTYLISCDATARQFVVEDGDVYAAYFYNANATTFVFKEIQIELSSTATTYEPYSNICPISGWTAAKVTRYGKNLCESLFSDGKAPSVSSGTLVNANNTCRSDYIPVNSGSVTFSCKNTSSRTIYCFLYGENKDFLLYRNSSGNSVTVTHVDAKYAMIRCDGGVTAPDESMLELGSTATDYEPYAGQTYDITFPTEAGTVYGGTLDVTKGELVVDRAQIASYNGEALPSTWISDRDVYASGTTPTIGAQVVYHLATPITYSLTPQEITSLLGINNLWADTGDSDVEYRADTTLYISRLTEPDTDMIADANIVSGQYFMVGNSLYRATSNIASGASVIVGTNAVKVSLATALNEINQ